MAALADHPKIEGRALRSAATRASLQEKRTGSGDNSCMTLLMRSRAACILERSVVSRDDVSGFGVSMTIIFKESGVGHLSL